MAQGRPALMPVHLPPALVVDCSVIASAFLPDEASPLAAAILDQSGHLDLVAPRVLRLEFLNVALLVRRRGRIDEAQFRTLLQKGSEFLVTYDELDPPLVDFAQRAYELGLTSYDYAYVELAWRRRLPLATLDRPMMRACVLAGVQVISQVDSVHERIVSYDAKPESTIPAFRRTASTRTRRSAR